MVLGDLIYGNDLPNRQTAQLDPTTTGLIDKGTNDAINYNKTAGANLNQNISNATQGFSNSGGFDSGIKQKYGNLLGSQLENYKEGYQGSIRQGQIDALQRSSAAVIAKQQVQNDIFSRVLQDQLTQEQARASAIGSVAGLAGTGAGLYAASKHKSSSPPPSMSPNQMDDSEGDYNYHYQGTSVRGMHPRSGL